MKSKRHLSLCCGIVLGVAIGAVGLDRGAEAQELAPFAVPLLDAGDQFSQALNEADGNRVEGLTTPALWDRLSPAFASTPPAGSFGRFEVLRSGERVKPDRATLRLLWRQPDGVEDVVTITLLLDGDAWKVCGGPTVATGSSPLTR